MITGLLALLGTVVGGLIVVAGNYLIERYKSKCAERSRYQQERLQLYISTPINARQDWAGLSLMQATCLSGDTFRVGCQTP
jgi:hypothetical protein